MLSFAMTALLLFHVTCVVLHVAMAAAWFGMAIRLSGESRALAAAEPTVAPGMVAAAARGVRQMGVFLVLALVFGLAAVFSNGGFETYSWATWWFIHVSLVLLLVLISLHYAMISPAWRALATTTGAADGTRVRRRLAAAVGVSHLIWISILVLMFWPRFTAALSVR